MLRKREFLMSTDDKFFLSMCWNSRIFMHICSLVMFLIFTSCFAVSAAEVLDLNSALQKTYIACVGIDEELADLKKMAGINTAITGVGTGLGIGATSVGITKARTDKDIEEFENYIKELDQAAAQQTERPTRIDMNEEQIDALFADIETYDSDKSKLEKLNKKSKSLGNWRTGLVAGAGATNVAGVIIAAKNKVNADLQTQIDECKTAVNNLNTSIASARINGEDVKEAQNIFNACREYNYVDITPINKRAIGSTISSGIGAGTGVVGTITSAVANTDKTRKDSTDSGKQKEKNLNTASNVLAGATTVASGTATVFNAMQISAVKKVATVAAKCTEVLK